MAKISLYNKRMLDLMDYCISHGIEPNQKSFLQAIGFVNTNNINKVRTGEMSFTLEQIAKARKKYKVDAEFFFQENNPPMFRVDNKKKPIALLKEAVALVERQLKEK